MLEVAKLVSTWSKDPSTKVGAVIADSKNRIVSTGYNGFPRGVEDVMERLEDRSQKYEMTVHAEVNAILSANRSLENSADLEGCTLFTYPLPPCARCATTIIQSGITNVVSLLKVQLSQMNPKWRESNELATKMFTEANLTAIIFGPNSTGQIKCVQATNVYIPTRMW